MKNLRIISALFLLAAAVDAQAPAQATAKSAPATTVRGATEKGADKNPSPPTDSDVLKATMKLVPKLRKSETRHYVILSDTSPDDNTMIGSLLESTYQKYSDVCDALEWSPNPLRHKLVAIVFRDQRDYTDFSTRNDKVNKPWAAGYYSPIADRLVFYKADSSDEVKKAMKQLGEQSRRVQEAQQRQQAQGDALHNGQETSHIQRQLAAENNRIKDAVAGSFISTAVHEAAHQLFFHTDIQRRGASYPLWLAEGLATNFETERTDIPFGYQYDNWRRRDAFKLALDKDSIVPFEVLLSQDQFSDGSESNEAVGFFYAQAYVLTNWMLRERPTELRQYLESLRDGSYASADTRKEKFEAIFGPLARVERNWIRYEGRRQKDFLTSAYSKRVMAKAAKTTKAPSAPTAVPEVTGESAGAAPPTHAPSTDPPSMK
ncbi:MAG: DUF1570 domain-containing protein [Planctomycetes bacterium]|nr:DUF1570 domain-containing protein [Planctomycetota bacterium]